MTFSHVADSWFLTGPTAAGKSAVGIELARRLSGEIISLDSMALYRGMDIGTAKPSADERAAVPHHLLDVIEPHEAFSLAQYVDAAERVTADVLSRGRTPIFVGGTPLYLKALLRGMFQGPAADWEFRERLTAEAAAHDPGWLHEQVREVDAAAADRLHPQDTKRLIRVLEVFEKTGQPITALQQQFDHARPASQCRVFVLDWPREELYRRINARVGSMFAAGLVDEVRRLIAASSARGEQNAGPEAARQGAFSRTAAQALGYREVIEHLAGAHTLAETIALVQNRTRAFARRQLTWFRSLSECRAVPCTPGQAAADLASTILAAGNAAPGPLAR
ncbi:MAG TPA: tRNA (adenosine(37)-N6)-dimethylallyltransferase MiaA [Pirellulales bacterium]|nr:tRNA (adenosine(37)-N6)-dimethylallyltransferase MiaA [Pirellulales bacterium]